MLLELEVNTKSSNPSYCELFCLVQKKVAECTAEGESERVKGFEYVKLARIARYCSLSELIHQSFVCSA